jgi:hypothetical protein
MQQERQMLGLVDIGVRLRLGFEAAPAADLPRLVM